MLAVDASFVIGACLLPEGFTRLSGRDAPAPDLHNCPLLTTDARLARGAVREVEILTPLDL